MAVDKEQGVVALGVSSGGSAAESTTGTAPHGGRFAGGGVSLNGNNSGKGGDGANGIVIVTTYF